MKYLKLFESWNPLSDEDFANAQELHSIGVVSDQELAQLKKLIATEWEILHYTGVKSLDLRDCALLKSLPDGLKVGGNLNLDRCTSLESLPAGLKVKDYLLANGCTSLRSLPADLVISGGLELNHCTNLESLPTGLVVGSYLNLFGILNPYEIKLLFSKGVSNLISKLLAILVFTGLKLYNSLPL